jgi:DNA helicase-2/ATP-dependent DNA helicase PcrA
MEEVASGDAAREVALVEALGRLNDEQREAATHEGGPLLIVAGAGTGKTSTLTTRFAWLVGRGTPADRILAVTYTTDAAEELTLRLEQLIPGNTEELNVGTIHGLCLGILQDEAAEAGVSEFVQAAGEADRLAVMLAHVEDLEIEHTELRGRAASHIREWLSRIDRLKEEAIGPAAYEEYAGSLLLSADNEEDRATAEREVEFARVYRLHEQFLREAGLIDFGGMQIEVLHLLRDKPHVRSRVAGRFDHVLIDEFQDTSFVQLEIFQLLVQEHHNITVVGDDDQSIYRFRGASSANILGFEQRFGACTEIKLERNYRSGQAVVDAARAVVTAIPAEDRIDKNLVSARDDIDAETHFWRCATQRGQTLAIAHEIERLIAQTAVSPDEICVLVHSRTQAEPLIEELRMRQLPVDYTSANDFFDRIEIRDIVAWLKILVDPSDHEALTRTLMRYPVGLDPVELSRVNRAMKRGHDNLFPALHATAGSSRTSPETQQKIKSFLSLYERAGAALDEQRPAAFVQRLITSIGTPAAMLSDMRDTIDRFANLGKLLEMADTFAAARPHATARDFAFYLGAMVDAGVPLAPARVASSAPRVRVMTFHASKGLEFDHVFIPSLVKTAFRGRGGEIDIPDALLPEALTGGHPVGSREAKDRDLRRKLHVAMTRARRRLVLSTYQRTASDSRTRTNPIDPFNDAMAVVDGVLDEFGEDEFGSEHGVYELLHEWRGRVLGGAAELGAKLSEPRLDAHADTPAAIVEYAEYIKLSAIAHRMQHGHTLDQALAEVNDLIGSSLSVEQRAAFDDSALDNRLREQAEQAQRRRAVQAGMQPTLDSYLKRTRDADGKLMLSASDIKTYQRCPQLYCFEKVMRVPQERGPALKLGIAVHTTLERYHQHYNEHPMDVDEAREWLLGAYDAVVRTSGLGDTSDERQFRERGRDAVDRYAGSELAHPRAPVTVEQGFRFELDDVVLTGKIDRIEPLGDGTHQLVDYKTGKKSSQPKPDDDVQLTLYRLACERSLGVEASRMVYYFVDEDEPVQEVMPSDEALDSIQQTVREVGNGIASLAFEPDPENFKCSNCSFRMICPAWDQ